MNFGLFKTEKRADGMTLVQFPQGEPYVASNVEVYCFLRIERLEAALTKIAAGCPDAADVAREGLHSL